ncbi:helix-turn-helix domain-containing protein [Carboxylicivirga marina]|uniref:Helix-turn-helix transcriptional regulator n=1 Tax=Carboxylicivirga marina TaxID=2800988 RepID=A0ABS1HNI4_9BACT|nr:helix-turn-helix transcriptional regulator [Carboxylicivirga marina]MBK3518719.1 helix-turn-helix transcriptional regulator [Carboxylicivirga marina]
MLDNFSEKFLLKAKEKGLSTSKIAREIGVSRGGLYNMLEAPNSIKIGLLLKMCELINWEIFEALQIDDYSQNSTDIIDFNYLYDLPEVILSHNYSVKDLELFIGISKELFLDKIKTESIDRKELLSICGFFNIPLDLFYKEQYKRELAGITPLQYNKHKNIINLAKIRVEYENAIIKTKLDVINLINEIFNEKSSVSLNSINFYETYRRGDDYSNFAISIIGDNSAIPIVFLSNTPDHSLFIQPVIEDISESINKKFLQVGNTNIHDIIWCELSYFSKDKINIALVKSESNTEFRNPQWLTIKNIYDKNIKANHAQVKEFLNME